MSERGKLRRVGSLWKPKPGGKSLGSGSLSINGFRQRFIVLKNDNKTPDSNQPDYVLMSSDEPEVDSYTRDHSVSTRPVVPGADSPF